MRALQDDIDDLDRMIENGSPKHEIRSQIRLIAREVASLQERYSHLAEEHSQLADAHSRALAQYEESERKHILEVAQVKADQHKAIDEWLEKKARTDPEFRRMSGAYYHA